LFALGVDRYQVELGLDAFARIAALESGTNAEIDVAGPERQGLVVLGGAAVARFETAT